LIDRVTIYRLGTMANGKATAANNGIHPTPELSAIKLSIMMLAERTRALEMHAAQSAAAGTAAGQQLTIYPNRRGHSIEERVE